MAFDITVSQHHVRRGPNNNVLGTFEVKVENPDFQHDQDFDYTGQLNLADIEKFGAKITIVIKEENGQSCVTGKIIVEEPIHIEKELDKNCVPIAAQ